MIRHRAERKEECRENMRGGKGKISIRHWFAKEELPHARLCAQLTIPPGGSIGPHQHENEEELFIVLSGKGILTEDDKKEEITAGDAVLTGSGASHAVENPGTEPLELVAVIMQNNGLKKAS